jgi:hypothetical protein
MTRFFVCFVAVISTHGYPGYQSVELLRVFGVNQFGPLAAIRLTVEKVEVDVA